MSDLCEVKTRKERRGRGREEEKEEAKEEARAEAGRVGAGMEPVARSVHSSGMRSIDVGILHIRGCRSTSYAFRCQPCRLRAGP